MKITLYKSSLCPRCHVTRKTLEQLVAERDDLELELVDILASPGRTASDGIRMIPAVACGEHRLSGVWLGRDRLKRFIDQI